jgi:hypothetical protein
MSIPYLYNIYILSLLLTENTNKIDYIHIFNKYAIRTKIYYKHKGYIDYYDYVNIGDKNLLNKIEPKRESSCKKIKKFVKNYKNMFQEYFTLNLMNVFIKNELVILSIFQKNIIIVVILTGIKKKYGRDIYDLIRMYL